MNLIPSYKPASLSPRKAIPDSPAPVNNTAALSRTTNSNAFPTNQSPPAPQARAIVPGYDEGSNAPDHLGIKTRVGPLGTLFYEDDFPPEKLFEPGFSTEVYHCDGIPGPHDFPKAMRQEWQSRMGVSPREFFRTLFATPQARLGGTSISVDRDEEGIRGLEVEMDLHCPRTGRLLGHMDRQFSFPQDSPPEAYHRLFDLVPGTQGKGIARNLLANSIKLYDQAGISRVGVFASLGVGGYAWAKYGFHPKPGQETSRLFATIGERLRKLDVSRPVREVVERMLAKGDPKAIWAISDLDGIQVKREGKHISLGKALLLGTAWRGSLNLDDPEARTRFDQYVHKTDSAQERE